MAQVAQGCRHISQITDEQVIERLRKGCNYKQTSGDKLLAQLATLTCLLQSRLVDILSQPSEARWKLQLHFKSPLALKQHVHALVTTLKCNGRHFPSELLAEWLHVLDAASAAASGALKEVEALFAAGHDATPKTVAGYVNDLMNMAALLNVGSVMDILADPVQFRVKLSTLCKSPYTESTYISRVLSIFKANPQFKEKHKTAYEAWQRAASEHRARHLQVAKQNAPTSARQAENYAPMDEWRQCLEQQLTAAEPHATLRDSMTVLFLAYACTMPPKRAEIGTLRIFNHHPTAQEQEANPNYIVLSDAVMQINRHKTSKHAIHKAGITEVMPKEFMAVLRASLERWPRTHLFVDARGQAYDTKGFSKWVIRTTGRLFGGTKAPGISLLRHSFCTALDFNRLTGAQREEVARRGHTPETQDRYRFVSLVPTPKQPAQP